MTQANKPAFPNPRFSDVYGLTKREYFACAAMQGQISYEGMEGYDKQQVAGMSIELADALLAALEAKNDA